MHERGEADVPAVLLALIIVLLLSLGLVYHIKSRASRQTESRRFQQYLLEGLARGEDTQVPMLTNRNLCAVCETPSTKRCSGCKAVYYCSTRCQSENWSRGHKFHCRTESIRKSDTASTKTFQVCESRGNLTELNNNTDNRSSRISAAPFSVSDGVLSKPDKVLFPYDRFIEYFKWDRMRAPCGLINLGNSCFANVVLQCLTYTRPLTAYLLQRSHQKGCKRNDWCFMCELGNHVLEAFQNSHLNPFSPIRILSRLRDIGNHLGSGRQEDAHEFMRFAIDSMQSICLDEAGGEKVVDPRSQLTTLVQYIFGGLLQSQVKCFQCNHVSNKYENMMDLAVEIQGAVGSLEDALTQFTAHEWLDGENKYKCDRCNGYVKASKRLALYEAPNILTIALKRFQSGKFGKLNKRVTFPMDLDMSMYMSEIVDKPLFYQLYAVIVHVDMLNASFFGHYVCYVKDMHGTWYKVDDSKVKEVDIEKVLSQKAYMLMYSRQSLRPGHSTDVRKEFPCQAISASLSASSAHLGEVCNSASAGASTSEKLPFKSLNSSLWTEQGCMSSAGVLAETALRSLPSNPGSSKSHFMAMLPFEEVNNLSNVSLQSDERSDESSHGSDNKNEFDTHISLLESCNGDDPLHMKVGKRRFETDLYPLHRPEPLEVDQLPSWPHLSCPPEVSSCFNGTDAQQGRSLNPCFPSSLHEEISCESVQTEQDSPAKRQHLEFCLDHSEESYNVLHKDSGGPKLHFAVSEKDGDSIVDTLGQNTGLSGKLSAVSCMISKETEHMLMNREGEKLEGEDLEMPSMIRRENEGPLINIDGKNEGSECERSMLSKEAECTMMDIEEESECEVAEVCSLAENGLLDTYGGHLESRADGIEQYQQDIDNLGRQSVSSEIEATCHTPPACCVVPILLNGPSDNGKLLYGITNGNSDDFGSPNSAKVGMVNKNDDLNQRPSENPTTSTSRIVDTLKEHVSEIEHIKVMEQSSVVKVSPHAKPLFARGFLDKSSNGKSRTVNLKKESGVLPVAAAASIQIDFQDKTRLQVPSELEIRPGPVKLDSLGDQGNFIDRTDIEGGKSPMNSSAKPTGSWIKPGFLVKSNSGRNKTYNGSQGDHPILVAPTAQDSKTLESKLGPDYSLCQEIVKETTAVVPGSHLQAITRQKPRRNDPCACGSQRKWKKCCGENGHL